MHHIIKHKPAVDSLIKYAPKFYFEVIFTEVEYPEDDHEQDAAAEDDGEGGVPPGVTIVIITMTVLIYCSLGSRSQEPVDDVLDPPVVLLLVHDDDSTGSGGVITLSGPGTRHVTIESSLEPGYRAQIADWSI